ncbi:MAG: RNA polymerase sigma factor [Lachnospiraceae bacterium]|nr:RNA polymerase sigma factor [Lachnospiraceae bacterium]
MDGVIDEAVEGSISKIGTNMRNSISEPGENVKRGNRDAIHGRQKCLLDLFIKTVSDNKTAMYRLAFSFVLSKQDAEDVISEAVLKAYSHLDELRNIRKMKSWLFRIIVNESKICLKKRNRMELVDDISEFEEVGRYEEKPYDLLEFVCLLDDNFKEVIMLYYFEEFRVKEIANILNISQGTVKSRLSRARLKLKRFLENSDDWKG